MGTHLAEAMRVKGMSTEKLAQTTNISERFIDLIIEEKYSKLPAAPYLHGYIVRIGEVLGIDGEALWGEHLAHESAVSRSGPSDLLPGTDRFQLPFGRRTIIALVVSGVILLYVAFRLPGVFGKPELTLSFEDGVIVTTSTFVLSGSADPKGELTVNGEVVYPNGDGTFTKQANLIPGFNTFTVSVKRIMGAESSLVKQVFFKTAPTSTSRNKPAADEGGTRMTGSATGTETIQ